MENIAWFFCQVLFVGGAGGLLVQSTLAGLDTPIHVELLDLVLISLPTAIFAVLTAMIVYYIRDRNMMKKYYGSVDAKSPDKSKVESNAVRSDDEKKDGGE
jgi:uncharacterized membrane protein